MEILYVSQFSFIKTGQVQLTNSGLFPEFCFHSSFFFSVKKYFKTQKLREFKNLMTSCRNAKGTRDKGKTEEMPANFYQIVCCVVGAIVIKLLVQLPYLLIYGSVGSLNAIHRYSYDVITCKISITPQLYKNVVNWI